MDHHNSRHKADYEAHPQLICLADLTRQILCIEIVTIDLTQVVPVLDIDEIM